MSDCVVQPCDTKTVPGGTQLDDCEHHTIIPQYSHVEHAVHSDVWVDQLDNIEPQYDLNKYSNRQSYISNNHITSINKQLRRNKSSSDTRMNIPTIDEISTNYHFDLLIDDHSTDKYDERSYHDNNRHVINNYDK